MTTQSWCEASLPGSGHDSAVWLRAGGTEASYGALRKETARLAKTLGCHGIRPGSTVAVHGVPSFTQLWAMFALWSLGAQVVLLDPRCDASVRDDLLAACAPQFLITFSAFYGQAEAFVGECEVLVRKLHGGRPRSSPHCLVQFSSGTTGRPKAIGRSVVSLRRELDRLRALPEMPRAGEHVAVLESTAHSFGLICGLLYALDAGATVVLPAAQSPDARAAAAAGAHIVIGNPGHFEELAQAPGSAGLPGLRLAVSGGEALTPDVARAFASRYGVPVGQAYGITETGVIATDLSGQFGCHSVGAPLPGVLTRVAAGELEVHAPEAPYQRGNWPGGWIPTGDLASVDHLTGVIRLRGRAEGAERADVDLLEIESVLCAHELVTSAVVVGTDPVEAHVASPDRVDGGQLRSWCRRFLGDAMPRARYHIVRDLPRTTNGRVIRDRAQLRAHRAARYPRTPTHRPE